MAGGHFFPEQNATGTIAEFLAFFSSWHSPQQKKGRT
jgi:hypothetical protein